MSEETDSRPSNVSGNWQFKPGDSIEAGTDSLQGAADKPTLPPSGSTAGGQAAPLSQGDYVPENPPEQTLTIDHPDAVTWSASEFIHHHKSVGWYGMLALTAAVVSAGVYLLTKDIISTAVIIIVAIVLGIYAARKPRTLNFKLDTTGLTIGEKFYDYGQFRSFAVVDEDAFASIVFTPLKRFMPLLTVYYPPPDESRIVSVLSDYLPMEAHRFDMVDQLLRRIRF